jgi:hypothetical protein
MQDQYPTAKQAHIDAGDGVERTVTQARGGVRRGLIRVLVISTLLVVGGIGAVWLFSARSAGPPMSAQTVVGAPAPQSTLLKGKAWDRRHLGANGLEKCHAFRLVLKHAAELQSAGGGTISSEESNRLQAELDAAKRLQPASVTPVQCGVPL